MRNTLTQIPGCVFGSVKLFVVICGWRTSLSEILVAWSQSPCVSPFLTGHAEILSNCMVACLEYRLCRGNSQFTCLRHLRVEFLVKSQVIWLYLQISENHFWPWLSIPRLGNRLFSGRYITSAPKTAMR